MREANQVLTAGGADKATDGVPLLKFLREKKKLSRMELSRLTRLSTYQVEGLEGKGAQSHLARVFLYIKALGYKVEDVVNLMESGFEQKESAFLRGILGKPLHETNFETGIKLLTYLEENGNFLGQLELGVGKVLGKGNFPAGDVLLGVVREGTLVIDLLAKQTVHKKNHFFLFPGSMPVEFSNGDNVCQVSALLFCVTYPR